MPTDAYHMYAHVHKVTAHTMKHLPGCCQLPVQSCVCMYSRSFTLQRQSQKKPILGLYVINFFNFKSMNYKLILFNSNSPQQDPSTSYKPVLQPHFNSLIHFFTYSTTEYSGSEVQSLATNPVSLSRKSE